MIEHFGEKFGLDEKGGKLIYCILPPLAFILGGALIIYFGVDDYYHELSIGFYDADWMGASLKSSIIIGSVIAGIGLIIMIVTNVIRILYKTGYFSIYGFSYNKETKMLSIHNGHRNKEFYIGNLEKVRVNNTFIDKFSYSKGIINHVKTPYGFVKVCFRVNGRKKWAKPFGLIDSAGGAAYYINSLYNDEMALKEKAKEVD